MFLKIHNKFEYWETQNGWAVVELEVLFKFKVSLFPSIFSLMLGYRFNRLQENVAIEFIQKFEYDGQVNH